MAELSESEFPDLLPEYLAKFGNTFSPMSVPGDRVDFLVAEMKKAIDGDRGPITDDELGTNLPDGALS